MFDEMKNAMNAAESIVDKIMDRWDYPSTLETARKDLNDDMDDWERNQIIQAQAYIELACKVKEYCIKYVKDKCK